MRELIFYEHPVTKERKSCEDWATSRFITNACFRKRVEVAMEKDGKLNTGVFAFATMEAKRVTETQKTRELKYVGVTKKRMNVKPLKIKRSSTVRETVKSWGKNEPAPVFVAHSEYLKHVR